MIDRCRGALLVAAAAYLALLPSGALSFWRSLAFAAAAALAVTVVVTQRRAGAQAMPLPNRAIPLALGGWALWTLASVAWSVDPAFSAGELKADVLWGLATIAIFYIASVAAPRGFEWLTATALGALGFWTALALGLAASPLGWDTRPFHRGDGAFATYLVTVAPLVLMLVWTPPVGIRTRRRDLAGVALLFALVVATAQLSENRIVWIAFAVSLCVAALCAPATGRARRWAAVGLLLAVFALMFANAAHERAEKLRGGDASLAGALVDDPRLDIWRHASERIRARPWLGYGYGLHILGREIGADTGDAAIQHPHNLFVSQWLQTGAIGALLFVAMLGAIAVRFSGFVRSRDTALARIGALGLAVLAGFVVRNLTDDFFLRANGKLLFATTAMLLGAGTLRARDLARPSGSER